MATARLGEIVDRFDCGMKILYYSPHPDLAVSAPTGYGTHMREMIHAFKGLGHEVHFYIGGEEGQIVQQKTRQPNTSYTPKIKSKVKQLVPKILWETSRDLQLLKVDRQRKKRLTELCREFNPDLIYERSHYGMISGVRVAKELRIRHVLEVNSPNVQERIALSGPSLLSKRAQRRDEWAFQNSNHVLTVSTRLAQMLNIPVLAQRWNVTPNAIRPGQEVNSKQRPTRGELQIPEKSFLIGFVGSIFPWHGVDLLIDSIRLLVNQGMDARALIVGDGSVRTELIERSKRLEVADRVTWTGAIPNEDVYGYSSICSALIMAKSNEYGSPVKLFEYALSDRPVIAPNYEPVKEVMEDRVHGLLVPPDADAIAHAVLELQDSSLARKLSENWRNKVLGQHTWQHNAKVALNAAQ
jgi:glycosyltransferase involved in cell wall biosynthesis